MMSADFAQPVLPLGFVRQWVGIRAPQFLDHLALRNERAFGFWSSVAVIERTEYELCPGQQGGFAQLLVQGVRGVI